MAHILITGRPGIGKTTLIKGIARQLSPHAGGFYTEEVRAGSERQGFRVQDLEGREGRLADKNIRTEERVGKYYVDVPAFEAVGLPALREALDKKKFVIIDEIGSMEERSKRFKALLLECFNSEKTVIATIKERGSSFVEELKKWKGAHLFRIDERSRDSVVKDILKVIHQGSKEARL
jgi:nucleoside-triphosphatase